MKVICIDSKPRHYDEPTGLTEGMLYTVIRITEKRFGQYGYVLKEIDAGYPGAFEESRFIPCSDIDETELVNTIKEKI